MKYGVINQGVLVKIPKGVKRILDVGCGPAVLGKEIKRLLNCEIVGITINESEARLASKVLDKVVVCDLNSFDTRELGKFDCVLCSNILEHLCYPEQLLERLRFNLTSDGILIVALPNALYWKQRLEFIKGNFEYRDEGPMDYTHMRFFDYNSSFKLIRDAGYEILSKTADGHFPLPLVRKILGPLACFIDKLAIKALPDLFGVQFLFIAQLYNKDRGFGKCAL